MVDMLFAVWKSRNWASRVLIDTYSTANFWYAVLCAMLCRALGLAYIPILHGGNLPRRLRDSPRLCRKLFGKAMINVAPSGYLQKTFADAGFAVRLVPNPVNLENFQFAERDQALPRLLWVRGLSDMSCPEMAIRTAALVGQKYPSATLVMVGPDPRKMWPALHNLAATLDANVDYRGKLSQTGWAALAGDCDIFINTSKVDNAPYSLVEAMALGLFVVSTNVGGIPYLAEDGRDALLVGPDDPAAMANAVFRILEQDGLRLTLQAGARAKARNFDKEAILREWDEILQQPL